MGRPAKQPQLQNRVFRSIDQHSFLHIVDSLCPNVFNSLRADVSVARAELLATLSKSEQWRPVDEYYLQEQIVEPITDVVVENWAKLMEVSGTWIEDAAKAVAIRWVTNPASTQILPLVIESDVSADAVQEIVIRIPLEYELRFERPYFEWGRFREVMTERLQPAFEGELEKLQQFAVESHVLKPTDIPNELQKKMEVTALYLFGGLSPQEIAKRPGYSQDRTVLHRWIRQTTELLDLEAVRKRRGRSRKRAPSQRP